MPSEEGVAGAGIVRDVSDRRQRERRLDVLDRVLRHNIRNELTAVINLADAIEIESERESVAVNAVRIRELSRDLATMSDRIRKLAAVVEEGQPDEGYVDAVTAVDDAVANLATEYPAVSVAVDLPETLPVAATGALAIAVEELLVNAVEHNDRDDPTVRVSATDSDRPGDWVDIRVEDDGPGIPETERTVVEREEITPLQHGSGLGLWAVVWVAESFHGDVFVEDNEPRGTVVTIQVQRQNGET
jgi:signal transduction histidine kinase